MKIPHSVLKDWNRGEVMKAIIDLSELWDISLEDARNILELSRGKNFENGKTNVKKISMFIIIPVVLVLGIMIFRNIENNESKKFYNFYLDTMSRDVDSGFLQ